MGAHPSLDGEREGDVGVVSRAVDGVHEGRPGRAARPVRSVTLCTVTVERRLTLPRHG